MSILIAFLLLILPGYLATLFLPWVSGFYKRLAFSIVISVSSEVILSYLLVVFDSSLIYYFLSVMAGITLLLLALALMLKLKLSTESLESGNPFREREAKIRKITVIWREWKALQKKEKAFFWAIFVLSLAAGIFVFYPHFGYQWPIHADEWWDVSAVQSVLLGRPLNTNPYLFTPYPDYKPGFTSFWAGVLSGGINPVGAWVYLPAFNVFLISFVGSLLLYEKAKNFWAAGFLPLLLVSIRSNIAMLGWWFFVPSSFALLFVLFLLLAADELFLKSRLELFIACLVSIALALVYLPFLGFILLSFISIAGAFSKKFPLLFFIVVCIGLAVIVFLLLFSPYKAFWSSGTLPELSAFFVSSDATVGSIGFYSFFNVVSVITFIAGVFGFYFLRREKWALVLLASAVVGILDITLFYIANVTFLAFPQRSYYFTAAIIAVLASIGLGKMLASMKIAGFLKWGIAVVVLGLSFWGYFILLAGTATYYLVGSRDLKALTWLKERPNIRYQFILSEPPVGTIITPLTGAAAPINWLTLQGRDNRENPLLYSFFSITDCSIKRGILSKLKTGLVYSYIPQSCPFLEEIYNADGVFIYRSMI